MRIKSSLPVKKKKKSSCLSNELNKRVFDSIVKKKKKKQESYAPFGFVPDTEETHTHRGDPLLSSIRRRVPRAWTKACAVSPFSNIDSLNCESYEPLASMLPPEAGFALLPPNPLLSPLVIALAVRNAGLKMIV